MANKDFAKRKSVLRFFLTAIDNSPCRPLLAMSRHRLYLMRASQLASEYDFREASLLEWFQWEKWETAKKYAKLGPLGLAKKKGVKFRKDRGLKPGDLDDLVKSLD